MISIYQLKPRFQQLLMPLAAALHRAGVTANMVTLAAMLASIAYGVALLLANLMWSRGYLLFLILPLFLFIRMAMNAIDGMLARQYQQQSKLGAMLNEVGDVVSDAALFLPFAFLPLVAPELVVLVVLLAMLNEFVGVLGQVVAGERRYDGPMGKSDRAFVFGVIGLLVGLHAPINRWLDWVFVAVALLLLWSTWNRGRNALRT